MKRILGFVSCIILIPAIIAGAVESDKNAELFQGAVTGNLKQYRQRLPEARI